jgi:predicted dinucleotide-binding enzyme
VAIPSTNAVSVVANYGESLAGKILVDISNPFNADAGRSRVVRQQQRRDRPRAVRR